MRPADRSPNTITLDTDKNSVLKNVKPTKYLSTNLLKQKDTTSVHIRNTRLITNSFKKVKKETFQMFGILTRRPS